MEKGPQKPPKRRYPAFYEKAVPVALALAALAVVVLLVIIVAVLVGAFPTLR